MIFSSIAAGQEEDKKYKGDTFCSEGGATNHDYNSKELTEKENLKRVGAWEEREREREIRWG